MKLGQLLGWVAAVRIDTTILVSGNSVCSGVWDSLNPLSVVIIISGGSPF